MKVLEILQHILERVDSVGTIEHGEETLSAISGSSYGFKTITFKETYEKPPQLILSLTGEQFRGSANPYSITTTQASIRIDNMGSATSTTALKLRWTAISRN